MRVEVHADADAVARAGARRVAHAARHAVDARGRFLLALSGGSTPWAMLAVLRQMDMPWDRVHVTQADERAAPAGHDERNWSHVRKALLDHVPVPEANRLPLPAEAPDLDAAAVAHARRLETLAGAPPVLDLVHLGLGDDGHTASLVPGDPALDVDDAWVAATRAYQGRRRLTLTFPVLAAAHEILWLVTGASKAEMVARLRAGDRTIPAGRVPPERAVLLADRAAADGG